MQIAKLFSTLLLIFVSILSYGQVVTNATELNNAIRTASPGATITLANGTWNNVFIDIDKNGTSNQPITITAQNPGSVLMTGNSRVYMEGAYITVSGLVFQDASNLIVNGNFIEPIFELNRCDNCKIINNKVDSYNGTEAQKELKFKWVFLDESPHAEIAYNSFIGKYGIGSIVNDNRQEAQRNFLKIHHNYFADRTPINGVNEDNDQDAIRIGTSTTSLSDSFSEVYENYFYNFFGEIEIISNKSGQNKYYNNTFRDFSGCLTLRHGNNCEVFGNYFFAEKNVFSAGVRVIGEGHKIYNNYIEGINSFKASGSFSNVTGGINVSNGQVNSPLNGYLRVIGAEIVNNTFVDCDYALRIGTRINDNSEQPIDLTVANNIMYNTSIETYQITTRPTGNSISEGNIENLRDTDMEDDGYFHRITNGSAAMDAGVGNYSYLRQDVLGGFREANFDAGAEEFGANGRNLPFTADDVGETIGFGATIVSNPVLSASTSAITLSKDAGRHSFEVVSNVDWTITENMPWLSLDVDSGTGNTTVTATFTENTTGASRLGNITIEEVAGGEGLSVVLSVEQLNTFSPNEIPIIGTTSMGTQIKDDIAEENAYNDDVSNYWTGNPDTEPEVSITFDLSCVHELSEIGINFWKANERTTTFSIAVADDAAGPFTTVLETATSEVATVETEQFFRLDGTFARYVKFIGIGNSSATNWTSIANVNIYGNLNCEGATSVSNEPFDESITIFPVPTTDGKITISSSSKDLKNIEIFNIAGQKILTTNGNGTFSKQIDVTKFKKGIYFIRLEEIGQGRFILQ